LVDFIYLRQRKEDRAFLFKGFRTYMRPDFYPSQADIDHLAEEYLVSVGLA